MTYRIFLVLFVAASFRMYAQLDAPLDLQCLRHEVVRSQIRSVHEGNPCRLTATPVNQIGEHIAGLTPSDFVITKGRKRAEILEVKELTASENTVMRIIFMIDNSQSMSPYLETLLSSLENIMKDLSPAVRVSIVLFSERNTDNPQFTFGGRPLSLIRYPYTADKKRIIDYARKMLIEPNLSRSTYLYDGVYGAIEQISADTGRVDKSFAIVFSDGADNASRLETGFILKLDKKNTVFYTIDFLTAANDFLVSLARNTGGEHFMAKNADELTENFRAIAKKIVAKGYEIVYRFKPGPSVTLAASTDSLRMEEEIVRETFPLLNYVFFDQGSSALPQRYAQLTGDAAGGFAESGINGGAMNYYYNVLNIIGSRMRALPETRVTIAGYVNNVADEKANKSLADARARIVQSYLRTVWGISEDRLVLMTGVMPPVPSTSNDTAGQAENRRVEITSDSWEIMKPVMFVNRYTSIKPETVQFTIEHSADEGLAGWTWLADQSGRTFDTRSGSVLERRMTWNWHNTRNEAVASKGDLACTIQITDSAGDKASAGPVRIAVVKEVHERLQNVTTESGITREKISLILFPFDVYEPGARNERILEDYVFPRINAGSSVSISGYTDIIGSEEYNQKLSEKRAEAVYMRVMNRLGSLTPAPAVAFSGFGKTKPQHDNITPEGRFYNRTVGLEIRTGGQ
jgi:outer membrane protein OmpA-like peptidoglycan-associated protein